MVIFILSLQELLDNLSFWLYMVQAPKIALVSTVIYFNNILLGSPIAKSTILLLLIVRDMENRREAKRQSKHFL